MIRETPSACDTSVGDPVLISAQGSLRVITLADGGPRPLTRADLLYVRSEPVPLFVHSAGVLFFPALASPGFVLRGLVAHATAPFVCAAFVPYV